MLTWSNLFGFRFPAAIKQLCAAPQEQRVDLLHRLFVKIPKLSPDDLIAAWHTMESCPVKDLSDIEENEILECIRIAMVDACERSPQGDFLRKRFEMVLGLPLNRPVKSIIRLWLQGRSSTS